MSVHHLTVDDTRAWFQASDREVFIGDVLDVATTPTTRVRFGRYGRGAAHEWVVTHDETLIVTRGALAVRSAGGSEVVRAGEVMSLGAGTRVVYVGEEDDTAVVFVTHLHRSPPSPQVIRPDRSDAPLAARGLSRLVASGADAVPLRRGA